MCDAGRPPYTYPILITRSCPDASDAAVGETDAITHAPCFCHSLYSPYARAVDLDIATIEHPMDVFLASDGLLALATLAALEIVLGVDNLVFIAIVSGKLPASQQPLGRKVGLSLALVTRIALLLTISWMMGLTRPLFTVLGHQFSGRAPVVPKMRRAANHASLHGLRRIRLTSSDPWVLERLGVAIPTNACVRECPASWTPSMAYFECKADLHRARPWRGS